jgi:hypothetical protein
MSTLLDLYMSEVGQNLPRKIRADIGAELRSLLEDALEDRGLEPGNPQDEEAVAQVLTEFGSPEQVAASYLPERYLIGPRVYPAFSLVMKVGLVATAVHALTGLGAAVSQAGFALAGLPEALLDAFVGFTTASLQLLGNAVLAFTVVQWPLRDLRVQAKGWNAQSLKAVSARDRVRTLPVQWGLVITVAVVMIFNFYPQIVSVGHFENGEWRFESILTAAFSAYLPWLNLVWVASIILDVMLLSARRWRPVTRWLAVGRNALAIAVLYAMLNGPPVARMPQSQLTGLLWAAILGIGADLARRLLPLLMGQSITLTRSES